MIKNIYVSHILHVFDEQVLLEESVTLIGFLHSVVKRMLIHLKMQVSHPARFEVDAVG